MGTRGHHSIDRREERGGHKARDITQLIARRRKVGTKSWTSHHRSPGERRAQSQGHHTIDHLGVRGGHETMDITPLIAWRREVATKPRTSHH